MKRADITCFFSFLFGASNVHGMEEIKNVNGKCKLWVPAKGKDGQRTTMHGAHHASYLWPDRIASKIDYDGW